jgi:hypothetical protein
VSGGQLFGPTFPRSPIQIPNRSAAYYAEGGMDWKTYWGVLHNGVDIDQLVKAILNVALPSTIPPK